MGDRDIRDLELPFWTVTADLVSGREVVLGSSPLWQALDATSAIPGIFPPVAVGERLLIDGWVVNPIPVDVLRREGADVVVAVDVAAGADPTLRADLTSPATAAVGGLQRLRQRLANPRSSASSCARWRWPLASGRSPTSRSRMPACSRISPRTP